MSNDISGMILVLLAVIGFAAGGIVADILSTSDKEITIKEYKWFDGGQGNRWWVETTEGEIYGIPLFDDTFQSLYHPGDTIVCVVCRNNIQSVKARR